jgi:HAD superfamily hydrolase (TIGR01509 family)
MVTVIRAVVFDFDGLVIDTEGPVYQGWVEVYAEYGQHLPVDFWSTIIGRGQTYFDAIADLERRVGRPLDREAVQARWRRRARELVAGLQTRPGVREWHAEALARGVKLGVASSSSRTWVTGHLERLGLDGWHCVRCRDDVERAKPAPDVYLAALSCLGVAATEAVALEDSATGVEAAKAAGLHCVAVPGPMTSNHDFSRADLLLASLADSSLERVAATLI